MRRVLVSSLLVVSLLSTSILTGCFGFGENKTVVDPNTLKTVTYALDSNIDQINPIIEKSPLDGLIFRGLMKFDENNTPQKDLATDVSMTKDGSIHTFKIAKGVKFQDGTELTADDVVFTIRSIMDADVPSKRKVEFRDLKDIKIIDKYSLKILLNRPSISMLDKLTIGIVSQKAFKTKILNFLYTR